MGKASRRRKDASTSRPSRQRDRATVPFVRRPFEGLPGETEWVAMREILPAATATVRLVGEHAPADVEHATVATVLPMAWAGLRRADNTVLIGTQSAGASGDTSRDLAAQLLAAAAGEPGTPVPQVPQPTPQTPRLQDLIDTDAPFEVELHDGFDFWVADADLEGEAKASMERANESVVPTHRMQARPSTYWCQIGERTYLRIVLPEDEDVATAALARLHARGEDTLGEGTRLLGAFRACGLLVPVIEVDRQVESAAYEDALGHWSQRYHNALADDAALTDAERRARSGLLSRQVTLR